MDYKLKQDLREALLLVFRTYKVDVAVGTTRQGVAIRSQDERVDAQNIGPLRAL